MNFEEKKEDITIDLGEMNGSNASASTSRLNSSNVGANTIKRGPSDQRSEPRFFVNKNQEESLRQGDSLADIMKNLDVSHDNRGNKKGHPNRQQDRNLPKQRADTRTSYYGNRSYDKGIRSKYTNYTRQKPKEERNGRRSPDPWGEDSRDIIPERNDRFEERAEKFFTNLDRESASEAQISKEVCAKFNETELEQLLNCAVNMKSMVQKQIQQRIIKAIETLIAADALSDEEEANKTFSSLSSILGNLSLEINSKQPKATKEQLVKLIEKFTKQDDDPFLSEHQKKIDTHEKTLEFLQPKQRKTKTDIQRMQGSKDKIQELEDQKKQYLDRQREILNIIKYQFKKGVDIDKIITTAERLLAIEQNRLQSAYPIYAKKSEIIKMIEKNQFVILIGETGSGKSTQIVQYMLESPLIQKTNKMIACIQPRKLAVQTVSKRVADELQTKLGDLVGYQTGLRDVTTEKTRIKFMMDRLFLNELFIDRSLKNYSCVVIDEAHERNINTDILLSFIKETAGLNPNIRFVITSATLNEELFVKYFNCKSIKVSGRTYPVDMLYYPPKDNQNPLDAIEKLIHEIIDSRENKPQKEDWNNDFEAPREDPDGDYRTNGHILAFLSGVDEIEAIIHKFETSRVDKNKYAFLPLHGRLTPYEQRRVFAPGDTNITKVIFSTRIAETAVTINDVNVVIDIGYDRDYVYDKSKRLTVMVQGWITQAQANQRAGRAGRTRPGKCYRIFSQEQFDQMERYKIPELKRVNLDHAVLKLKLFKIADVLNFDFIESPDKVTLEQAIDNLKLLGALDDKEQITKIGEQMVMLPTDPGISRAILEAIVQNCLDEVCKIIAVMTYSGNLFYRGKLFQDWEYSDRRKFDFCHPTGDLMTFLQIFETWESLKKSFQQQKDWCKKNTLNGKCLRQSAELYEEIKTVALDLKGRGPVQSFLSLEMQQNKKDNDEKKASVKNQAAGLIDELLNSGDFAGLNRYDHDLELEESAEISQRFPKKPKNTGPLQEDSQIFCGPQEESDDQIEIDSEESSTNPKKNNGTENEADKMQQEEEEEKAEESKDAEQKVQYPDELEIDAHTEKILKCFLCAFFPNLALTSGNSELGYTFLRENKLIRIHGASVLSLQGIYPKWIVCGEIQIVNGYNCTKIASYVDINWIKKLIPMRFLQKFNILRLEDEPIYYSAEFSDLGSNILQSFQKGKGERLQDLKQKYNVYIDVVEQHDKIVVWSFADDIEKVCEICDEIIEEYKKKSAIETIERSVAPSGLVRAIIGPGAVTQSVLLGDEFRKIDFRNLPFIQEIDIEDIFSKYGAVDWVEISRVYENGRSGGSAIFKNSDDAKTAYEKLQDVYEINSSSAKGRTINPSFKVVFKWFTGRSECRGLVKFADERIAQNVLEAVYDPNFDNVLDDSTIKFSLNKTKPTLIMVGNLAEITDDISLKRYFKNAFPQYELLVCVVFRVDHFADQYKYKKGLEDDEFANIINNFVERPDDIIKFEILPVSEDEKQKYRRRAELLTKSEELAQNFVDQFNYKTGILGRSRLHVEINRSRTWRIDNVTFGLIKRQLDETTKRIQEKMGGLVEISILGARGDSSHYKQKWDKYTSPALRVRSEEKTAMDYVMSEFQKIFLGFSYYLNNKIEFNKIARSEGKEFCNKVERSCRVRIYFIKSQSFLKIQGEPENIERAKEMIAEYLKPESEYTKLINFRGLNVRKLLKNDAELFKKIEEKYSRSVLFDLRLSLKKIILVGPKDKVDQAEAEIMSFINQNEDEGKQTDATDETCCPICYEDLIHGYRLEYCGHKVCLSCLEKHVRLSVQDTSLFPINCPVCNEDPKPISQTDLRNSVPENILEKIWTNSYKNFLQKNLTKYCCCHSPGCENIYLLDDPKNPVVSCMMCSMKYCRKCKQQPHEGQSCEQFKDSLDFEKNYVRLGLKKCSKCHAVIEKNGGCNHIKCKNCDTHLCWVCLQHFSSSELCYNHMAQEHGGHG